MGSKALSNVDELRSGLTSGVSSVNTRTGAVTLASGDITAALGFTPASLSSPALTGTPTTPTATAGTNSTQVASTAFVAAAVAGSVAGVSSFNTRTGAVTLTGADIAAAAGASPLSITQATSSATDGASISLARNANFSGGTIGYVNGAFRADTAVSAGVTSFEWTLMGIMHNSATAGENVGIYGQGNKLSTGPTWGACMEVCDLTNSATTGSSGGTVGLEVDCWCNGADAYSQRIGLDIVVGNAQQIRSLGSGAKGIAGTGLRIGAYGNQNTNAAFRTGINIMTGDDVGILNSASGTRGIYHTGTYVVGIDLSAATHSGGSALRIKGGDFIALDAYDQMRLKYNATSGAIEFYNGTTRHGYINMAGGADVDLASGSGGAGVDLTTAQTVAGLKTFTSYISANAGVVAVGMICNGDLSFGASNTLRWPTSGNIRATNTSWPISQVRVQIDGVDRWINLYG